MASTPARNRAARCGARGSCNVALKHVIPSRADGEGPRSRTKVTQAPLPRCTKRGLMNVVVLICVIGYRLRGPSARFASLGMTSALETRLPTRIHAPFDLVETRIVLPDPFLDRVDFSRIDSRSARLLFDQVGR